MLAYVVEFSGRMTRNQISEQSGIPSGSIHVAFHRLRQAGLVLGTGNEATYDGESYYEQMLLKAGWS